MSETKSILEKVKELVFEEETIAVAKIELMDVTTADGVILRTEEVVVGATITVVDAEGVEAPANGDYSLEDGTVIKTEEGVITEVVVAEIEEEEEQEMEAEANPLAKDVADLKEAVKSILVKFEALDMSFSKFKEEPAVEEVKLSKREIKISEKDNLLKSIANYRK
jgi:hypothetical protein